MRAAIVILLWLGACAEQLESPAPKVDSVEPALACNDQFLSTLLVHGTNLTPLPVDVATDDPKLTLPLIELTKVSELDGSGEGADAISLIDHTRWVDDKTMEIDVDPAESLPTGGYDVTATNPDDQAATAELALAIVPPPTASALVPDRVCLAQGPVDVELQGSGFLVVEGTLPTIDFGGQVVTPNSAEDCFDAVGPMDVQSCNSLPTTLAQDLLPEGLYDVVLTNPEPAQCITVEPISLQVFPPPTLAGIEPVLSCDDGANANTFRLTGTGFLVVDGANPTVTLGPWSGPATTMESCAPDPNGGADQICTGLTVDVPTGDLPPGVHDVVVTNPPPVGCSTAEQVQLEHLAAPTITEVDPASICETGTDTSVILRGDGFILLDMPYPGETRGTARVQIGDFVWSDDPADLPAGATYVGPVLPISCAPLTTLSGEVCTEIQVDFPPGFFPRGTYDITVVNPFPADCDSTSTTAIFEVSPPPNITAVQPPTICDNGQTFTILGTEFAQGATVALNGTDVASNGGTVSVDAYGTQIDVTLPYGWGAGIYDVTVSNGTGCEDTAYASLEIVAMPIVFFVDPPVVYNQIEIQATIYVSGINGGVQSVTIEEAATGVLTPITDFQWDPLEPGQIQAVLPAGLPEGDYHVHVLDDVNCDPNLDDAFFEEADLTFTITAVDPSFGWDQSSTAVEITGGDPLAFQNVPRVYFNPVGGAGTGTGTGAPAVATELRGVDFKDGDTLNAVVPSGLPVDSYDVIVVNPDGTIGLLSSGFDVVPEQPPIIESVSPSTLPRNPDEPIVIFGSGFLNPRVEAECTNPDSGAFDVLPVTVVGSTLTQIDGLFPANGLSDGGGVCIIVVYSDYQVGPVYYTTFGKYAAVSVTNPSQNLYSWRYGPDLLMPRIAPAAAAGRSTRIARNLYAIGGDDGLGVVHSSIEKAPVGQFGDLSPWSLLDPRQELPAPRTMAAVAQLGRFIYLAGGYDGVSAVDTIWRAQILDPETAPAIDSNLVLDLGTGVEMDEGTYVYKVAALFDATYDDNPNGESLTSDPFVVRVPDRPEKIVLTLSWNPVPGAAGYRIYRSTTGSGNETWYRDVMGAGVSFVDDGTPEDPGDPAFGLTPLPQGSLGAWENIATMTNSREGACAAIAPDPLTPGDATLYIGGGRDATGTVLDTVEYLTLQEVDDWDHEVTGVPTQSLFSLPGPRWQCQAYQATSEFHPAVAPGDTWIYFGGGMDPGGAMENAIDSRLVGSGEFVQVTAVGASMKNVAGYVYASASDFLYSLGGGNGNPTTGGDSSEICDPSKAGCAGGPEELRNWNALGFGTLLDSRYLPGSAQESSVIFAVGGEGSGGGALTSVEFTNY